MPPQRIDLVRPTRPRRSSWAASHRILRPRRLRLTSASSDPSRRRLCWWTSRQSATVASDLSPLRMRMWSIAYVRFTSTPSRTRRSSARRHSPRKQSHRLLSFSRSALCWAPSASSCPQLLASWLEPVVPAWPPWTHWPCFKIPHSYCNPRQQPLPPSRPPSYHRTHFKYKTPLRQPRLPIRLASASCWPHIRRLRCIASGE